MKHNLGLLTFIFLFGLCAAMIAYIVATNQVHHPAITQTTLHKAYGRPIKVEEVGGLWIIKVEERYWKTIEVKEIEGR
ncbi:MAG TPA: hypothetical protein VLE21_05160 [Candidatus Nitrosocosmicus sp.]|nr:hypothetical protein [Candidatus Nitrosocosmicus sp.]